ncbi:MAG: hypothetical protein D6741_12630 [Planctomycetota bacterium]|nr:MAG: hypothetical protein D6741_12630 [Planctomycetota bacterium]
MQSIREIIDLLACPETHTPLAVADDELVAELNEAVRAGTLVDRAGNKVTEPLQGALVRDDGCIAYPVRESIPVLLIPAGIPLDQPALRDRA